MIPARSPRKAKFTLGLMRFEAEVYNLMADDLATPELELELGIFPRKCAPHNGPPLTRRP